MTKHKVIDGVEASKCEYMYKDYCYCDMGIIENRLYSPYLTSKACCSDNPNCYYKQLQRKTQECEKLKEEMKQIKKDLRKRFSVQNVPDGDIIITCSKKQTCYAHLHAYEAMSAYCRADKKRAKYKSALEEIEEFCLVYRDNPVEGSAYKKILDIITKAKEQE